VIPLRVAGRSEFHDNLGVGTEEKHLQGFGRPSVFRRAFLGRGYGRKTNRGNAGGDEKPENEIPLRLILMFLNRCGR